MKNLFSWLGKNTDHNDAEQAVLNSGGMPSFELPLRTSRSVAVDEVQHRDAKEADLFLQNFYRFQE